MACSMQVCSRLDFVIPKAAADAAARAAPGAIERVLKLLRVKIGDLEAEAREAEGPVRVAALLACCLAVLAVALLCLVACAVSGGMA